MNKIPYSPILHSEDRIIEMPSTQPKQSSIMQLFAPRNFLAMLIIAGASTVSLYEVVKQGYVKPMIVKSPNSGLHGPIFSFGIVTDVQYCNCQPAGDRFFNTGPGRLREALSSLKANSVDFVFNLGDLIDRDYESFKPLLEIINSSDVKTYHLLGNHDFNVDDRYKKKLPLPMPSKEGYYSFVHNNFRFIALNGNELSIYASTSKPVIKEAQDYISALRFEGSPNCQVWNGGMTPKQLEWLKYQLDKATANGEKVFIFSHFPVFPKTEHNLLNDKDVLYILKGYTNVIAFFAGHNHYGKYGSLNMTHFVNLKGMVETENTTSFARVEVYGHKIWIHGTGREKSVILAY